MCTRDGDQYNYLCSRGIFSLPDDIRLPIFTGKGVVREIPLFATVIYMAERRPERRTLLLSADLVRSLSGFITALQILAAGRATVGNRENGDLIGLLGSRELNKRYKAFEKPYVMSF